MIEVNLAQDEAVPAVSRSFVSCLASVTETPIADVPQPQADWAGAISHWRSWLAGRSAGLVTRAKPATFNSPGYWLAILGSQAALPTSSQALGYRIPVRARSAPC